MNIPPAALEAGARALYRDYHPNQEVWSYGALTPEAQERWRVKARAAFLAMLEAWPGFHIGAKATIAPYIILPLPQEITLNAQDISALAVKSAEEEITLTEQENSDE